MSIMPVNTGVALVGNGPGVITGVVLTVPPLINGEVAALASVGFALPDGTWRLTISAVNGAPSLQVSGDNGMSWRPCVSNAGVTLAGLGNGSNDFTPSRQISNPDRGLLFRFVGSGGSMGAGLLKIAN